MTQTRLKVVLSSILIAATVAPGAAHALFTPASRAEGPVLSIDTAEQVIDLNGLVLHADDAVLDALEVGDDVTISYVTLGGIHYVSRIVSPEQEDQE